jgi:hypothetical protein
MEMKKTSVYLSEEDRARLARLAKRKGESQAWVIREALLAYDATMPDKNYAMFRPPDDEDVIAPPEFDDFQQYQDWLDKLMREGLLRDYEREGAEVEQFFGREARG